MSSNVVVCVLGAHERLSAGDLKLRVTRRVKIEKSRSKLNFWRTEQHSIENSLEVLLHMINGRPFRTLRRHRDKGGGKDQGSEASRCTGWRVQGRCYMASEQRWM